MKYRLAFVFMLFFAGIADSIAQSRSHFGMQFSPGIPLQKRHSEPSKQISVRPKLGFKTGVFFQFDLNKRFNIETSLNYTLLKNGTTSKTEGANVKYKFGLYSSGAQFSVLLNHQTDWKENYILRLGIGASINYMEKDNYFFEDLDYSNTISVKRNQNCQLNSSVGIMKKGSKFYFGVQLDFGLFINYVEDIKIQNEQSTYWIKSSSAFFTIKYYPFLKATNTNHCPT